MPFRILVAGLMLLVLSPVVADDWFAVEVLVFQHREDSSSNTERFPTDPGSASMGTIADLVPPTEPASVREYEQTAVSQLRLSDTLRVLGRSSRYQTLMHVGWRQIGRPPEHSVPVRIHDDAGKPLEVEVLEFGVATDDSIANEAQVDEGLASPDDLPEFGVENPDQYWVGVERLQSEFSVPPAPQRLAGTVRLSLQRFLHVEVDLTLTSEDPLPMLDGEDWYTQRNTVIQDLSSGLISEDEAKSRLEALNALPRFTSWRHQESRRVRTGEVHYLDHPRFGVIVLVTPIPSEELEARTQALEAAREAATSREAGPPEL